MTYYPELASVFVRIAINLILVGMPITVGIFIVLRLTRAASPRARYLLTVIAFFAAAVIPFVVTMTPTKETPRHRTIVNSPQTNSADISAGPLKADTHTRPMEILPQNDASATGAKPLDSLVRWLSHTPLSIGLFTIWLAGACLLLAREAASHLRVARARRQWKPASAELRERLAWPKDKRLFVDDEFGPCAVGVFNPVVVVPARLVDELSITAARQIARHELDHLKWQDPFVHAVMRIVRASLWPSAPLWYLNRATRLEREAASDRAAVYSSSERLQPDIAAAEYASTLVSIAMRYARLERRRKHAWVATEVGNESGLNDRVRRLMAISGRLTGIRLSVALATLLVSASSLVLLPVARLESKPSENAEEIAPQQPASTELTRVEAGPAKGQLNRPARPATLDRRLLSEVEDGPQESTLPQTQAVAKVADGESAAAIAANTATGNANTIEPKPDYQHAVLESQMAAVGYKDLTAKQLADMRAYAVGPAYVKEMADSGYSGLSADMLIQLKWLAVSSSFIREMRALGYDNLSPRTLLNFRQHGVNSEYIRQMRSRISGSISSEQMDSLRFYGASTEFVDKLKAMGYANLNAGQLISMRLQGVSIEFIKNLEAIGYANLTANQLISMRLQGVSIEFIKNLEGLGYANLTADQLISMRQQAVSIEFIKNLHAQGHKGLSANDIIGMRQRGNN